MPELCVPVSSDELSALRRLAALLRMQWLPSPESINNPDIPIEIRVSVRFLENLPPPNTVAPRKRP